MTYVAGHRAVTCGERNLPTVSLAGHCSQGVKDLCEPIAKRHHVGANH
jgi:hypothetical protein